MWNLLLYYITLLYIILYYSLTVNLSLNQIWVCITAGIEKVSVQRDDMDISVHVVMRTQWFFFIV